MTTSKEWARKYAERIRSADDEFREADRIIADLDRLVFRTTRKPVTTKFKDTVIELIRDELIAERPLTAYKEADNAKYLALVHYMQNQIRRARRKG